MLTKQRWGCEQLEATFLSHTFKPICGNTLPYLAIPDLPPQHPLLALLVRCGVAAHIDVPSLLKALRALAALVLSDLHDPQPPAAPASSSSQALLLRDARPHPLKR
eukprot:3547918-Rhodomonas_salina.1